MIDFSGNLPVDLTSNENIIALNYERFIKIPKTPNKVKKLANFNIYKYVQMK